ncbi:MAG: hypothetical protein WEB56_16205 [Roseovarius sp.]
MTQKTNTPGPQGPAVAIFSQIAPIYAAELSHQLYRAGLVNSNDLIGALVTGLRSFARDHSVCLASDFRQAWPEALQCLQTAHTEADWEGLLAQSTTAPRAKDRAIILGASQLVRLLEASRQTTGLSPRVATALGAWLITAVILAQSSPLNAGISLDEIADCL